MLNKAELNSLMEVISDPQKTFENALQQFQRVFNKQEQFKACCALCYLLENNVTITPYPLGRCSTKRRE